jgi:endonuclease/exonuclease/phosphatase family metal-dependent hydrolase
MALAGAALAAACRTDDQQYPGPAAPDADHGAAAGASATGGGGAGQGGATPDGGAGGGGAGGAGGASGASGGVSILSWNIEGFPLSSDTPARVAEILGDLDPDLVGVEEVSDPDAFLALPGALPGYAAVLNDDPGAFLRVGLLYKTSRLAVSDVETLFPDSAYAFPRPPLKARVATLTGPAFDFVFLVLHLKAQLDDASRERRRAACEALDTWVRDQRSAGPEQDFVLAGDWNDELTDAPAYNVFQVFLDDPRTYTFLTWPAAQEGEFSYIPFQSMIDHILVTTDALGEYGDGTTSAVHLEATYPDYEATVSDHRPILSRFAVSP